MATLDVVSFNLHGLNNSELYLRHLLNLYDIVLVQEHWQFSRNFSRLASLSNCHDMIASDGIRPHERRHVTEEVEISYLK